MASIFRDFSFEPASRQPSWREAERAVMNVSPSTPAPHPARPPTPPPCSVGDLAHRLDQQSLRVEIDPSYEFAARNEPLTPPSDDGASPLTLSKPPSGQLYSRISSTVLRMQRQANTRMQCSSSHIKDISTLVQKMIEDEEQCHVCESKPPTSTSPLPAVSSAPSIADDDDEGVDMDYNPPSPPVFVLNFRRSSDRVTGCTTISRNVRMRKKSRVMKRSSR